jgi:hypothetical protein
MVQTALKLVIVGMIYDLNENIAGMLTMSGGTVGIIGGIPILIGTMMIAGPTNTNGI